MTPREILDAYRKIAVVGLSDKPGRPSHSVAAFLLAQGYEIIPVNPLLDEVLGLPCYPDLRSIRGPVEIVDIFRRSEFVSAIVDDAITIGVRAVWMQLGVIDEESARRARDAGLEVVMDRCPAIELRHAGA